MTPYHGSVEDAIRKVEVPIEVHKQLQKRHIVNICRGPGETVDFIRIEFINIANEKRQNEFHDIRRIGTDAFLEDYSEDVSLKFGKNLFQDVDIAKSGGLSTKNKVGIASSFLLFFLR
jgi:hypothetical protein